jgi:hypothetical protein
MLNNKNNFPIRMTALRITGLFTLRRLTAARATERYATYGLKFVENYIKNILTI